MVAELADWAKGAETMSEVLRFRRGNPMWLSKFHVHLARRGMEFEIGDGVEPVVLVGVHLLGGYRLVDAASISRVEARLATFWSAALDGAEL